jgi:redox-sensitive bicupin YhaK (pirin superfamily)
LGRRWKRDKRGNSLFTPQKEGERIVIKYRDVNQLGKSDLGWLQSHFHFSFAEYYNPSNMHFGVLRVLNDDYIAPSSGFDLHPHRDMEIVTYVIKGELTHRDSMGNERILKRGEMQYMSAGTGVFHSEHNHAEEELHMLQIWIFPDRKSYRPKYGDHRFEWAKRQGKWLHMVSGIGGGAAVNIHQDINIYAVEVDAGKDIAFEVEEGRQAYLVQMEGEAQINGLPLHPGDALESTEETLSIQAIGKSHILVLEMSAAPAAPVM